MAWNSNEEREKKIRHLAECRYPVPKLGKNQVDRVASRDHYMNCLRDLSDDELEIIWKSRIDFEQILKQKGKEDLRNKMSANGTRYGECR
jgi:hypothetical protein